MNLNKELFHYAIEIQRKIKKKETFIKILDTIIKEIQISNEAEREEVEIFFIDFYKEVKTNAAFNIALNEKPVLKSLIERKNIEQILCNF